MVDRGSGPCYNYFTVNKWSEPCRTRSSTLIASPRSTQDELGVCAVAWANTVTTQAWSTRTGRAKSLSVASESSPNGYSSILTRTGPKVKSIVSWKTASVAPYEWFILKNELTKRCHDVIIMIP